MHPYRRYIHHVVHQFASYFSLYLFIQYENGTISCEPGRSCIIYCEQENSCKNSQILCPDDQACIISCGASPNACNGATIDARYSSLLELNDCHSGDDSSCHGLSIYFPPNHDGQKVAYLNTGDNMKQSLNFYAIYGWLDIDTSGFIGDHSGFIGEMHCSFWYQQRCDFHSDHLSCANGSDLCNSPHITDGHPISTTSVAVASGSLVFPNTLCFCRCTACCTPFHSVAAHSFTHLLSMYNMNLFGIRLSGA